MTKEQRELVEQELHERLSCFISDNPDRNGVVGAIIDDVIADIDECADWSNYESDEVNVDDIHIALARAIIERVDFYRDNHSLNI